MAGSALDIALLCGESLPAFPNRETAERELLLARDGTIGYLRALATEVPGFEMTWSPDSLKDLERWYFKLVAEPRFANGSLERRRLESALSIYLGGVLVQSSGYHWVVDEYAFTPGRYEIGVRRNLVSIMLTRGRDPATSPNNKLRNSLWRELKKWS